jgi:hypothetical protein
MMTATSSMSTAEITVICGHGAAKNFTCYPSSEINRLLSGAKTNCNPEESNSIYVNRNKGFVKKSMIGCQAAAEGTCHVVTGRSLSSSRSVSQQARDVLIHFV